MPRPPKWLTILLALWDTAWKAVAIRRAVQNKQYKWASALLFANTVGILPIVYLTRYARPSYR